MRATISILISLLISIWSGMAFGTEATTITVGGTGSGMGFMRLLGKKYSTLHQEVTVKVLPSLGTAGGIHAAKTGAVDLAVASRRLKEQELGGMKEYFLGGSPFVFAVNPATEVANVTLAQVVSLYNGNTTTWPDGTRIRRVLRPHNDSDWQFMTGLSPELAKALELAQATEGLFLAVTDTDAVSYLERIRGSFGPTTLAMVLSEKRRVKILSFNGLQPVTDPGVENYPLVKPYHLLARADAPVSVNDFIDFIRSDQGRQILAQVGIKPAGPQSYTP